MTALDDLDSRRFYRGAKADLKIGDLIERPRSSRP